MFSTIKAWIGGAVVFLLGVLGGLAMYFKRKAASAQREAANQKARADIGERVQKSRDALKVKQTERRNAEDAQADAGRRDHFDNNG